MSSSTSSEQHCFAVFFPYNDKSVPQPIFIPKDADVKGLQKAIRDDPEFSPHLENETLYLYKCGELDMEPLDALYQSALEWLYTNAASKKMISAYPLSEYFADGPTSMEDKEVDVIAVTDSILESPDKLAAKFTKDRIDRLSRLPSPSDGIRDEEGIKKCTNENHGVHGHRPATNYGPPTALFNHALARLKHRLEHLDQLPELEPGPNELRICHQFILDACKVYDSEKERENMLIEFLTPLFGGDMSLSPNIDNGAAEPDATWGVPYRFVVELKNEDGLGGSATLQAVIVNSKIVKSDEYKEYVKRSNCPVVLIGIMGTRLEISTAIFTDGIYVDKLLSEELRLDFWKADTILRFGRIFKALSLSSGELREEYDILKQECKTPCMLSTRHLFPNPLPLDESQPIPSLTYLGKLSRKGTLLKPLEDDDEMAPERQYALYLAKMVDDSARETDVVVKFTACYNKQAHDMLAAEGLAPKLHYCDMVVGGVYMVVMDCVEGVPLWCAQIPSDYSTIYGDLQRAMETLHRSNLVFGDLRIQNILLKQEGGAMVIDFDWAGKDNQDKYPSSLNDGLPSGTWHDGVGRRRIMKTEHDDFMLEKVRMFLEEEKAH